MVGLRFGDRFRVSSRSGTRYVARLLAKGEGSSGLFVRLDDRRIARLDDSRLDLSTFQPASEDGQRAVLPGDDVLVELDGGVVRGQLEAVGATELLVRTPLETARIARGRVRAFHLMFRARELKPGDRFLCRGRSGTEYDGTVTAMGKDHVAVVLRGGRETSLQRQRLDLDTLLVLIAVPLAGL